MKKYELLINGNKYEVQIQSLNDGVATVQVNGSIYRVEVLEEQVGNISSQAAAPTPALVPTPAVRPAPQPAAPKPSPAPRAAPAPAPAPGPAPAAPSAPKSGPGDVTAPMPGLILELKVDEGDVVNSGDVVVRMEAMKMENDILAVRDGVVSKVHVQQGSEVQSGQVLITIGD